MFLFLLIEINGGSNSNDEFNPESLFMVQDGAREQQHKMAIDLRKRILHLITVE